MAHVSQVAHGIDEAGHVGGGVEERRVLLGEDITKLSVGVLGPGQDRAHARVRRVQEAYLITRHRVNERREEGGV